MEKTTIMINSMKRKLTWNPDDIPGQTSKDLFINYSKVLNTEANVSAFQGGFCLVVLITDINNQYEDVLKCLFCISLSFSAFITMMCFLLGAHINYLTFLNIKSFMNEWSWIKTICDYLLLSSYAINFVAICLYIISINKIYFIISISVMSMLGCMTMLLFHRLEAYSLRISESLKLHRQDVSTEMNQCDVLV